jgi:hypothetical protein
MAELAKGFWSLVVGGIAFLGGCCFAALAPSDFLDKPAAVHYTLLGIVGSAFVALAAFEICRCDWDWEFLALRRNVLLFIICLAWCLGAVGGFAIFYVIPRFSG